MTLVEHSKRRNFDFYRGIIYSLIPRPSTPPVFDHLQYAYSKRSKPRGVGLGTRLVLISDVFSIPQTAALLVARCSEPERETLPAPVQCCVAGEGGEGGDAVGTEGANHHRRDER